MAGSADKNEHRQAATGGFRVENGDPILDQAALLHEFYPAPAGIARQVDSLRQRIDRQSAVALQLAENSDIHIVNLVHVGYISQFIAKDKDIRDIFTP